MFSAPFAFSLVHSIAAAGLQPVVTETSSELLVLEQTLFRAMSAKDEATLDRLLADDYVLRGSPDVDRTTWRGNALTLCWGERYSLADESVVDLGDTAVVGFTLTFCGDPTTCEPAVLCSLITDVGVRRAQGWQLAVRTSGPLGPGGVGAQFEAVELPPALEARSELSFVATGGNASTETFGASAEATYRLGPGTTSGRGRFVTSEADGVEWTLFADHDARRRAGRCGRPRRHVNTPVPGFGRSDRTVPAALVVGYARRALPQDSSPMQSSSTRVSR